MLNWLKSKLKKKPTLQDGLYLRLEGKVYIVDVKNGKEEISELPGETVLQTVIAAIVEGTDILLSKHNKKELEKKLTYDPLALDECQYPHGRDEKDKP